MVKRPSTFEEQSFLLVGEEKERDEMVFSSGEEFEAYRQRILAEVGGEK